MGKRRHCAQFWSAMSNRANCPTGGKNRFLTAGASKIDAKDKADNNILSCILQFIHSLIHSLQSFNHSLPQCYSIQYSTLLSYKTQDWVIPSWVRHNLYFPGTQVGSCCGERHVNVLLSYEVLNCAWDTENVPSAAHSTALRTQRHWDGNIPPA